MKICGYETDVLRTRTAVIGSGCAGLNAADWLAALGETDLLLITDGMNRGTSRNAGSDKQTYYKLSVAGDTPDSVRDMAKDLVSEGVNGDTALAEAAGSVQAFMKLVQLGVPFPTNEYGEFIGYQTDHDTRGRATSAGPLTSKLMTEALEKQVRSRGIPVLEPVTAFRVLLHDGRASGVLGWDAASHRLKLILAAHVILATGGPARIYEASVFPESQSGMCSLAIEAGARMANLHQWQYGLASVKFRWNVSGSYQQVLPRYVSVDADGTEREFLSEAFSEDPIEGVRSIFLKGYQWPFDVRKAQASSRIDLLVHRENALGRRVYMDFRRNPSALNADLSNLTGEARDYLDRTGSLQPTPFERLMHMNAPAVQLYRDHGIDIETEMLEIRVCAQHHNGGAAVDSDWQTDVPGLYCVGEAAGTFGAYRPGGSALNATQVGSMRAAQHIARISHAQPIEDAQPLVAQVGEALRALSIDGDPETLAAELRGEMSRCGAHMRDLAALERLDTRLESLLASGGSCADPAACIALHDQMTTQRAVISAILCAAKNFGSTGAGLVLDDSGEIFIDALNVHARAHAALSENLVVSTRGTHSCTEPARPIPEGERVFEKAWKQFRVRNGLEDR